MEIKIIVGIFLLGVVILWIKYQIEQFIETRRLFKRLKIVQEVTTKRINAAFLKTLKKELPKAMENYYKAKKK